MKKKLSLIMLAALLVLSLLAVSCGEKEDSEQKKIREFAEKIEITIAENVSLEGGKISFTVTNKADGDCYICGPIGESMVMSLFPGETDIYSYVSNSSEYYERDYEAGCDYYNDRIYFTVPAGQSKTFDMDTEWFFGLDVGSHKLTLKFTDDISDGIFETYVEKKFNIVN